MTPIASVYQICQYELSATLSERTYRNREDLSEKKVEQDVEEVYCGDCNIEGVGLLIHVWSHDGHCNEEGRVDDEDADGLNSAATLTESDEHTLDHSVCQYWDNEKVHGSLELDIEKAPLVQCFWIGVENVGGVLVHHERFATDSPHFERSPREDNDHGGDGGDTEHNLSSRVALRQLPEAEHDHLGETDKDDAEKNTLQDESPSVAEIGELVRLHLAGFDQSFTDVLESHDSNYDKEDK